MWKHSRSTIQIYKLSNSDSRKTDNKIILVKGPRQKGASDDYGESTQAVREGVGATPVRQSEGIREVLKWRQSCGG